MTRDLGGRQMSVSSTYLNPNLDSIIRYCEGLSGDNIGANQPHLTSQHILQSHINRHCGALLPVRHRRGNKWREIKNILFKLICHK